MNKKVLTLCVSALLAGAVGTASAQSYAKYTANPTPAEKVTSTNYYQLSNGNNEVLAMVLNASGNYELKMVARNTTDLRYTLWGIIPSGNEEAGYSYSFVNYATNLYLAVNSDDAIKLAAGASVADATGNVTVGGNVNVWKWVSAPDLTGGFTGKWTQLTSSFGAARDSVVVLSAESTYSQGYVSAVKYAAKDFNKLPNGSLLKVIPADPAAVVLGVDDLNSMLWKGDENGKLKLTFDKDVEGGNPEAVNLFTKQAYKAVPAVGFPANYGYINNTGGWSVGVVATTPSTNETDMSTYAQTYINYVLAAQREAALKAVQAALGTGTTYTANQSAYEKAIWALNEFHVNVAANENTAFSETKDEFLKSLDNYTVTSIPGFDVNDPIYQALKKAYVTFVSNTVSAYGDIWGTASQYAVLNLAITGTAASPWAAEATLTSTITTATTATATAKTALDADTTPATWMANATATGWVSLQANSDDTSADPVYLKVGTSFLTSDAGNTHLAFEQKKFEDTMPNASVFNATRQDLNGRYNFQFTWFPSADSIVIRTAGFAKKPNNVANWEDMTPVTNPNDLGLWKAWGAAQGTSAGDYQAIDASHNGSELNLVKITVLADNHREVTVGSSEYKAGATPISTINTRISINAASQYELTTLPSGVYFFNLSSDLASKKFDNGKYYVAKFCGNDGVDYEAEETTQLYGIAQDFGHMPRTQWVVEQNPGVTGQQTVNIYNREFPSINYTNIQLYKGGDGKVFSQFGFAIGDTLSYALANTVKPNAGILTNKYLGYYKPADENEFQLNRVTMDYFSGIEIGNFVNVSSTANDTTVFVDVQDGKATFQLVPSKDAEYGYDGTVAPQLYRCYYTVKVYDGNKLVNNAKWIARDEANENTYKVTADENQAVKFYLKENNQLVSEEGDTTCYYALVDFENANRVGVRDGSLKFTIEDVCEEERVATFAVKYDESIIYRELNGDETVAIAEGIEPFVAPCVANFYRARIADKQYLFESAHQGQFDEEGQGINYLGVRYQGGEFNDSTAIYVDTADVRNPYRPQYMLAVGTEVVPAGKYCPIHGFNSGCLDEHLVDVPAQVWGRYLINAQDSLENKVNGKDYLWENQYTRLAFVEAMHTGDTLVIFKNGEFPLTSEGHKDYLTAMEWARNAAANTVTPGENDHVYVMNVKDRNGNNTTKTFVQDYANYKFMFRLVDDADARNFIIESHDGEWDLENNTYTATENEEYRAIKVQNGVPVIARHASASEAILNAEWWNIDERCTIPTANETISAEATVSVVATDGGVIVKGAEGKNVIVSTILGKVVANETVNSDNETIAAPAGIVVVSVDGESFKVVVK